MKHNDRSVAPPRKKQATKPRGVQQVRAKAPRRSVSRQAKAAPVFGVGPEAAIAAAAVAAAAKAHEEVIALRAKLNLTRDELLAELAPPVPTDAGTDELLRLKLALAEALELRFVNLPVEQRDIMDQLVEARQQLQDAQKKIEEAQQQAAHAEREYALIRVSTSWRITAPLRRLVDALRALRARP